MKEDGRSCTDWRSRLQTDTETSERSSRRQRNDRRVIHPSHTNLLRLQNNDVVTSHPAVGTQGQMFLSPHVKTSPLLIYFNYFIIRFVLYTFVIFNSIFLNVIVLCFVDSFEAVLSSVQETSCRQAERFRCPCWRAETVLNFSSEAAAPSSRREISSLDGNSVHRNTRYSAVFLRFI